MSAFRGMIHDAARYLEANRTCKKHHVDHTGSNAYLLDFYDYLGEIDNGKQLVHELLDLIVESPDGGKVFYPGHLNPANMSQNVIDTGTAVDTISRFVDRNRDSFSEEEHKKVESDLREVVESYLADAAENKKVTNQRLWGLTGVASFARYTRSEKQYEHIVKSSFQKAFNDMSVDGYFRYYPDPEPHLLPYDNMTTFYQSRHTAFMRYVLERMSLDDDVWKDKLAVSVEALLSMYTEHGWKDMRMECKRWYWLSKYEVASHAFDAFALSYSSLPESKTALNNLLFLIRSHFKDGRLKSHQGVQLNFQCPIFWTAHLAWLVRIPNIEERFNNAISLKPFAYTFSGKEVFTCTTKRKRILVNTLLQERNPTTGIFDNGLSSSVWKLGRIPHLPHAFVFSIREVVNHALVAVKGFNFLEAIARLTFFGKESMHALLPLYSVRYGAITSFRVDEKNVSISVKPATKYGTVSNKERTLTIKL